MIEQKYRPPELKWWMRLLPWFWFGNLDDPEPPAKFEGHLRDFWSFRFFRAFLPYKWARALWWFARNPMHNFCHYTIGVSGLDIEVVGKGGRIDMWAETGWHWLIVKYKLLRLPYISYRDEKDRLYIGWGDSGQFGAEIKGRGRHAIGAYIILGALIGGFFLLIFT